VLVGAGTFGAFVSGCGSGAKRGPSPADATASERSLVFSVLWPERGRLVPRASESIVVRVRRDGQTVAERTVNRPQAGGTTRVSLERLPPGELTATATAYPDANGRGVAQADGSARLTAHPGEPFTLTVTMESTIDRLEIRPSSPSVFLDDSVDLDVTARDRNGNVVLVGDTFRWDASGSEAEIDEDSGEVIGKRQGTARVTVEETESGVRRSVDVDVRGVEALRVEPSVVRILDDGDAVITATAFTGGGQIANLTSGGWLWSVGSSSVARIFGGGNAVRVGGFGVGATEITLRTVAGGSVTVPVYVYPSRVSGTLAARRSGYDGSGTVYVTGDSVFASLGENESVTSDSLGDFPVDDSRLIVVEFDDYTDDFTDDDEVSFRLDVSGPDAPNGRPYFVFADSGGTSVSGTLTRRETSQVFRLIVRDPITGEARSRKSRRGPETMPSRGDRRRGRPRG
jgi:hypothetical protein